MAAGRDTDADAVMRRIEAQVTASTGQALPPPLRMPPPVQHLSWSALASPRYRLRFGICVVFNICHVSAMFVLGSWLSSILLARGLGLGAAFSFTAVSYAGGFLGPLIRILTADRLERRTQVVVAAVICATSSLSPTMQTSPTGLLLTSLVMMTGIFFISSIGFATYLPEIMPNDIASAAWVPPRSSVALPPRSAYSSSPLLSPP